MTSAGTVSPTVQWTGRAKFNFYRASSPLQNRAIDVVRECSRRFASVPDWYDGKKSLQGLSENVYELRATQSDGGHRVLVQQVPDALVIVDVCDHAGVREYVHESARYRREQIESAEPAPIVFDGSSPEPLFVNVDGQVESDEADELLEDWLWYLDHEQTLAAGVVYELVTHPSPMRICYHLTGGAGTGKTAILLSVARRLEAEGIPFTFRSSPALKNHLRQFSRLNIGAWTGGEILLIDDPGSPAEVTNADNDGSYARVICAFDPMQWHSKRLDEEMALLGTLDTRLETCYRQRASLVCQAQRHVSLIHDLSSWRVAPERIAEERAKLKSLEEPYLANLRLVKEGGRVHVYEASESRSGFVDEAQRLKDRWDRWDLHCDMPSLLLVQDESHEIHLPKSVRAALRGVKLLSTRLSRVADYKGLEFQAVWIVISDDYYATILKGKPGYTTDEWRELRDLHVPLTRAKDELLIFRWRPEWC